MDTTPPTPSEPTNATPTTPARAGEVLCADCKQPANVPFTPDASRPVYCRDCFAKRRTTMGPRGAGGPGGFRRGPTIYREPKMKGVGNHGFSRLDYPQSK